MEAKAFSLSARCAHRKQLGRFTLVELLVVIAIIAVLASMLLPALSSARQTVKRIACSSNMHQSFVACSLYANDGNGWYPVWNNSTACWETALITLKYLSNYNAVSCPSMQIPAPTSGGRYLFSAFGCVYRVTEQNKYFDSKIWYSPGWGTGYYRLNCIENASAFVWFADTIGLSNDGNYYQYALFGPTATTGFSGGVDGIRHGTASNYAAADGHVCAYSKQQAINTYSMAVSAFYR